MAQVTLGGRSFEARPLKMKHLWKILPRLPALSDGAGEETRSVVYEILHEGLSDGAGQPTAAWLDELVGSPELLAEIMGAAWQVMEVTGYRKVVASEGAPIPART